MVQCCRISIHHTRRTADPYSVHDPALVKSRDQLKAILFSICTEHKFWYQGKDYVRVGILALEVSTGKQNSSHVWKQEHGSEWVQVQNWRRYWRCEHCRKKNKMMLCKSDGTAQCANHLRIALSVGSDGLIRSQGQSVLSMQQAVPNPTAIVERIAKYSEKLRAQVMHFLEENTLEIKEVAQIIAYDNADLSASATVRSLCWKMGQDTVMDFGMFQDELKLRLIIFSENAAVGRAKIEGKDIEEAKAKARGCVETIWEDVEEDIAEGREKMGVRFRYLEGQMEDARGNIEVAHENLRPTGGVFVIGGINGETHVKERPMHRVLVVPRSQEHTIQFWS